MVVAGSVVLLLWAADGALDRPSEREEIIVTGERERRSIRDTDSSVDVFDSSRLQREPGVDRLDELFDSSPNVLLGNPNQGPTIRGQDTTGPLIDLSAFLGGSRSRMTLNIDGRAASYNEFIFGSAPLWDVAQVEIFKSPQSTVEGRNSIAGATYIRTRSPTFEWEGAARGMTDNRGGRQLSAMVSGPLISESLAFRLAADGRRGRPWATLDGPQAGADPNHDDYGIVRAKLLATPSILPGARFELTALHLRSKSPQTVTARQPFKERRDLAIGYGIFANRISTATLRAEFPLAENVRSQTIVSTGHSRFQRYAPPRRGEAVIKVDDRSLESRLNWQPSDSIQVRGGVHALQTRLDQKIDLRAILGYGEFDDRQFALGLFGEVEWKPVDRLSLVASVRRQHDSQDREGGIVGNPSIPFSYDHGFTFWLPRLAVRWDASETLRLGASFQRASNPGGASVNFVTGGSEFLEAETLWNAELFARARLLDGRLELTANLFRNWHKDAQRALPRLYVGTSSSLTWYELYNLKRARTEGLEATVNWRPSEKFGLRAGLGLLGTNILESSDDAPDFDGKSFARAPRRSLSLALDWLPLDNVTLSGRIRHHSGYFSDDLNTAARKIDGGTEGDVRAEYRRGPITFFGYARNVTDEFAVTFLASPSSAIPNKPREIGFGLETRF